MAWVKDGSIRGASGAKGASGASGAKGDSGSAATIAVGTVTTSAAGGNAVVTNRGSASAAVFDFTIPRGAQGPKGDPGSPGSPGGTGAPGPTLPDLVLGLNGSNAATGLKLWVGSAAQYASAPKNNTTVYIVTP